METPKLEELNLKENSGLIVYQISELKNLIGNLTTKFDVYREAIDKRVSDLEKWQAALIAAGNSQPKIDIQKIILAAFGIVSTALAVIQYLVNK